MPLNVSSKQRKRVNDCWSLKDRNKKTKKKKKGIYKGCDSPTSLGGLVFPFLTVSPSTSASKLSIWDSNSETYSSTEYITKYLPNDEISDIFNNESK
jgi:hypothetical protein